VASFSPYRSLRCFHVTGAASPCSATSRLPSGLIGAYGCSFELGAGQHRGPLVEQAGQRADQPGLALAALAEQHQVVTGEQGPLHLRQHGVLEAEDAGERRLAARSLASRLSRTSALTLRSAWPLGAQLAEGAISGAGLTAGVTRRTLRRSGEPHAAWHLRTGARQDGGMARFGDGLAESPDVVEAAERATRARLAPLGDRVPDLVFCFVSGADPASARSPACG
jgi:hypothetical protein